MEYKDYYKILGIKKTATQEEIKKAFRGLALKLHPDKNPNNKTAEDQFKLVNEANSVLSVSEKRKKYDELGENWQQHERSYQPNGGNNYGRNGNGRQTGNPFGDGNNGDFSDFFEQFFSGKPREKEGRTANVKGGNYETEMEISLEEAAIGTSRIIQLQDEKIRVTTKPGSYDDQVLRIKGKGATGSSAQFKGDLFVTIKVKPQAKWQRKGDDLYETQTIDLFTAVLGGDCVVATLTSQIKVTIAEGTPNGKTIRIKGKGMPIYDKPETFGDLYIQLQIQIPNKLTDKQRALFEELKNTV